VGIGDVCGQEWGQHSCYELSCQVSWVCACCTFLSEPYSSCISLQSLNKYLAQTYNLSSRCCGWGQAHPT
jgi:hypothetical protein